MRRPIGLARDHGAGREQRVAIEVDAARPRRELAVLLARLLEIVAFVGLVAASAVDAPLDQAVHAVVVLDEWQPPDRHLLALQVGENFRFPR
jgi:hypothetical protein